MSSSSSSWRITKSGGGGSHGSNPRNKNQTKNGGGRGAGGGGANHHVDPVTSSVPSAGKQPKPHHCAGDTVTLHSGLFHLVTPQIKQLLHDVTKGHHVPSLCSSCGSRAPAGASHGKEGMLTEAKGRLLSPESFPPQSGGGGGGKVVPSPESSSSPLTAAQIRVTIDEGKPLSIKAESAMTAELLRTLSGIKKITDPTQFGPTICYLRYCAVSYCLTACSRVKDVLGSCGRNTASGIVPAAVVGATSGRNGEGRVGATRHSSSPPPHQSAGTGGGGGGEKQMFQADVRYCCLAILTAMAVHSEIDFVYWHTLFPTSALNQCADLGQEEAEDERGRKKDEEPYGGQEDDDEHHHHHQQQLCRRLNYSLNHPLLAPLLLDPCVQNRAMASHAMHVLVQKGSQSVKISQEPTAKQRNSAASASFTPTSTSAFYVLESILCASSVGLDSVYTVGTATPTTLPASATSTSTSSVMFGIPDAAATRAIYWGLISGISTQAPFPKCPSLVGYVRECFKRYPHRLAVGPQLQLTTAGGGGTKKGGGGGAETQQQQQRLGVLIECFAVAMAVGAMTKTNDRNCFQLLELVNDCTTTTSLSNLRDVDKTRKSKKEDSTTISTSSSCSPASGTRPTPTPTPTPTNPLLSRFDYLANDSSLCSHPEVMKVLLAVFKASSLFQDYAVGRWWGAAAASSSGSGGGGGGLAVGIEILYQAATAPETSAPSAIVLQKLVLDVVMALVGEAVSNVHQAADAPFTIDAATVAPGAAGGEGTGAATPATRRAIQSATTPHLCASKLPQQECQRLMDTIVLPMLHSSQRHGGSPSAATAAVDDVRACCYKALYKFSPKFYEGMKPSESKQLFQIFIERGLKEGSAKVRGEALCGLGLLGEMVPQYGCHWAKLVQIAGSAVLTDPDQTCQMRGCFALVSLTQRLRKEIQINKNSDGTKKTAEAETFEKHFPQGYALYILNTVFQAMDHGQTRNDLTKVGHCFRCLGHLAHCFDVDINSSSFYDEVESRPELDGVANALILEFVKGLHRKKDTKEKNNALHGIGETFLCYEIVAADPSATRTLVEAIINLVKTETLAKVRCKAAAVLMRLPLEFFQLYSRQVFDAVAEALRTSGHHGAFTQFKEREAVQAQLQLLMEEVLVRLNPEDREEVMARFHQHAGSEPGIGVAAFIGAGGGSQMGTLDPSVTTSVRRGNSFNHHHGGPAGLGGGGSSRGGSNSSGPPGGLHGGSSGPILGGGLGTRSIGSCHNEDRDDLVSVDGEHGDDDVDEDDLSSTLRAEGGRKSS